MGPLTRCFALKLVPPTLPGTVIARERLLRLLERASAARLTLVAGPPGAGKTMLLAGWVRSVTSVPWAWLTLDDDDDDPSRFWPYLLSAVDAVSVGVGDEARRELALDREGVDDRVVLALINALASTPGPIAAYLVLDDVHVLKNPTVRRCLGRIVELGPAWLHFVIGSRSDPLLPLHRMRARGELLEIRDDDLRLTADEVGGFFAASGLADLDPADVRLLHERTEGWAAGLQLAALTLHRTEDRAEFVSRFAGSNRHVADFLVHEVLDRQPDAIQRFLLETSLLDVLSPEFCAAVTGRTDAAEVLAELEQEHLFLVPLDRERRTYRYHTLFREMLRFELRARHPGHARELQVAAAEWYEARADAQSAVEAWLAAGEHGEAMRVMEHHAGFFDDHGHVDVVRAWLGSTPPDAVGHDMWTMLGHASRLLIADELDRLDEMLDRVDAALADNPDPAAQAWALLLRGVEAVGRSDPAAAQVAFERAWELLTTDGCADHAHLRQLAPAQRAHIWMALAHACFGRFDIARQAVTHPVHPEVFDRVGDLFARSVLSMVAFGEGHLVEAERHSRQVLADANALGTPDHRAVWGALVTRGLVAFERNEFATAERAFQQCRSAAEVPPHNLFRLLAELGVVAVWAATGRRADAVTLLAGVRRRVGAAPGPPVSTWLDHAEACAMIGIGEAAAAEPLVRRLPVSPYTVLTGVEIDAAARAARPRRGRGSAGLARGTPRERLVAALVEAHAARTAGDDTGVAGALQTIVEIGGREGFVRTVLDAGPEVVQLLDRNADDPRGYGRLVRRAADTAVRGFVAAGPGRDMVEPLERPRAPGVGVPVHEAVGPGDRAGTVRLRQHREVSHPGHLPQARMRLARRGRRARPPHAHPSLSRDFHLGDMRRVHPEQRQGGSGRRQQPDRQATMVETFEITFRGEAGPALAEAFHDLELTTGAATPSCVAWCATRRRCRASSTASSTSGSRSSTFVSASATATIPTAGRPQENDQSIERPNRIDDPDQPLGEAVGGVDAGGGHAADERSGTGAVDDGWDHLATELLHERRGRLVLG